MNTDRGSPSVAIVGRPETVDAATVQAYLQEHGLAAGRWYAPRDIDEVDQALCAGRLERVVFARRDDFLTALWGQRLTLECWGTAQTRVEFAPASERMERAHIVALMGSWQSWCRRQRRAQWVSGAILSGIAILAAFTVLWLAR